MRTEDPRQLESHFAFGANWQSFVATVTTENVAEASRGLARLVPEAELRGRRFFDIGCGSGLTMLAAAKLGATEVCGIDIDPQSTAATRSLLAAHLPDGRWEVDTASVFELCPEQHGSFDIVHSWGVLHHTGDLRTALKRAAAMVGPQGHLVLAFYRRTPLCPFWLREKRFYAQSSKFTQSALRFAYQALYCAGLVATGRNPFRYINEYRTARGMSWLHDVHDWLGGYPYESVEPSDVAAWLAELGFDMIRSFEKPAVAKGLFGSHCDEFVARRRPEADSSGISGKAAAAQALLAV